MCICRKTCYLAFSGQGLAFLAIWLFSDKVWLTVVLLIALTFIFSLIWFVPCFIIFTAPPFARRAILAVAYWFLEAR